jgi:histidine phosphotransferase ChpT
MQIDIRALELLSSKLCHDLISPVSAINNGVELIEDIGGSVVEEAMKLIGDSSDLASKKLRLYRLAYGRSGSEANLEVKDVRQVMEAYFSGGKITLDWPEEVRREELGSCRGSLKVLINIFVLAEEVLAYGGAITLRKLEDDTGHGVDVEVTGRAAQLSETMQAALESTVGVDALTPRTIQAYMTGQFANYFGLKTGFVNTDPERLNFLLYIPPAAYDTSDRT